MKADNKFKKNIFFSFFNQIVILGLGILIPRLVLISYGSEANGLVSTVTQIFTYVALLEAGIGNASINALYKPIVDGDTLSISEIVSATKKYYRRITLVYLLCVLALSIVYPFFAKTELPYSTIALVILFQGLSGVVSFFFGAAYQQFLIADGKNYIVSSITLITYILTSVAKIFLMRNGFGIVYLQIAFFLVSCVQACLFTLYLRKRYPAIKEVQNPRIELLKQRKSFVVHEISSVIFSSTDVFVLSIFCNLKVASVYAIYNMVFVAISQLISSINNGTNYVLGHTYAGDNANYSKTHDTFECLYMGMVFSLFSVAYVLIVPFIKIYTRSVTDIQYVDYLLPALFTIVQLMSCGRAVSSRLITISGHAKQTQIRSIVEAIINLVASIILVNFIGIYGVLLGTIIALVYRMNDIIIYSNKKILKRSPWNTYRMLIVYGIVFLGFVIAEYLFRGYFSFINSYYIFVISGLALTIISVGIYFLIAISMNNGILPVIRRVLFKRR